MTAEEAAQLHINDELTYPPGWPTGDCNLALKAPIKILAIRKSNWSQSHVLIGLACANGKTTEVDASWFKAPKAAITVAAVEEDDPFADFQ
jgi:hypothetical protein